MTELKSRIHDESNGLDYVLVGDYYVPDLKLPEEHRPIGMWGRLHRTYLGNPIFGAVPPCKVLCPLFIRRTAYLPC